MAGNVALSTTIVGGSEQLPGKRKRARVPVFSLLSWHLLGAVLVPPTSDESTPKTPAHTLWLPPILCVFSLT